MFSRHLLKCALNRAYSSVGNSGVISAVKRTNRQAREDILTQTLKDKFISSPREWNTVRQEILGYKTHITAQNIDGMILSFYTSAEKYQIAEDYIAYLKNEGMKLNLATIGKYFKLKFLISKNEQVDQNIENELIETYENLRKTYPVLDSMTLSNVIEGLSVTCHWQLCLNLLNEMKLNGIPLATAYNAVVSTLFRNNQEELAWSFLQEMLENERSPNTASFFACVDHIKRNYHKQKDVIAAFEKLFYFFQENDIRCDQEFLTELSNSLNELKFEAKITKVSSRAQCKLCKNNLKKFELSGSEFDNLKKTIMEKVIIGKDVFNKSTPEELQRFNDFIAQNKRYNVVIDGLNVAYTTGTSRHPRYLSARVTAVANYFTEQNKRVLLLGREHMIKWPKFNQLRNHIVIFLTSNVSYDDPYLLYCALNSGKNTIIVSRDLMRSHRFLLKHYQLKIAFNRWLSQRLYQLKYVDETGRVVFKEPRPFTQSAQKIKDYWHIPLNSDIDEDSDWKAKNSDTTWLCVKF